MVRSIVPQFAPTEVRALQSAIPFEQDAGLETCGVSVLLSQHLSGLFTVFNHYQLSDDASLQRQSVLGRHLPGDFGAEIIFPWWNVGELEVASSISLRQFHSLFGAGIWRAQDLPA